MVDDWNRRDFVRAVFLAAGVPLVTPQTTTAAGSFFGWQPCARGHVAVGGGGNALLWPTPYGSVLVDSKLDGLGATLRREAVAYGGRLAALVVTHHHADHSGGIEAFTSDLAVYAQRRGVGRRVVALEQLKDTFASGIPDSLLRLFDAAPSEAGRLARRDVDAFVRDVRGMNAQRFAANVPFSTEEEMDAGDDVIRLEHSGRAHTDNDVWVRIPEANVVHAGDLLFNGVHPFIDIDAGATTLGWQSCLERVIGACDEDTIVIPGHGQVTDVSALRRQWQYFDRMRDHVELQIAAGRSRAEIVEDRPDAFAELAGRRGADNLGIVFDELGG